MATKSNTLGTEKNVAVEAKIPSPQNANCSSTDTQSSNDSSADKCVVQKTTDVRHWSVGLGWAGIFIFMNLIVFLGAATWSGLLLNERTTYQLESLECRTRLQRVYQEMGLAVDFEDTGTNNGDNVGNAYDENNISDRFKEQQFYWQELEGQVRYWKKEAKKFQRYGDGLMEQCRKDLRHLLAEVEPHKDDNQLG